MKKKSDFSEKSGPRGYELFLIIYIVLVILPAIILASGDKAWINIILSVILIALVIFYYFDKTYSSSVSWGMKEIYKSNESEKYALSFQRTHFWKNVDLALSFDIKPFLKNKIEELAVMGKMGSEMHILLLDPESKYTEIVEDMCAMKRGEYAYYALQIQNFKMRVEQASKDKSFVRIDIKYYDAMPLDNIFRAYDMMFAYDNKYDPLDEMTSYCYEKELNGFTFYKTLFDEKWNDEKFAYTKEITADMVPNYRSFADNDTVSYTV